VATSQRITGFLKGTAGVVAAFALSGIDAQVESDARRFETAATQPIHYKDWGKGQPVVFSHRWPLSADAFRQPGGAPLREPASVSRQLGLANTPSFAIISRGQICDP
jgi:hypothetical protein